MRGLIALGYTLINSPSHIKRNLDFSSIMKFALLKDERIEATKGAQLFYLFFW
jgi:hypothetical protein